MAPLLAGGRIILGMVLVVIGIVGLVLPGIQGIACIVIGAFLLGMRREQVIDWLERTERRVPWLKFITSRIRNMLVAYGERRAKAKLTAEAKLKAES